MTFAYQDYYTYEDYALWEGDWELFNGMPYAMSPSPSVTHQMVAVNITTQLKIALNTKPNCHECNVLMETDWQISNDTVVRPDVMVLCGEIGEAVVVSPDLVVEVVSSSSTKRDEVMKFDLYQKEGVHYYVLVYPDKNLAKVYVNGERGFHQLGSYGSEAIDFALSKCEFSLDITDIWR